MSSAAHRTSTLQATTLLKTLLTPGKDSCWIRVGLSHLPQIAVEWSLDRSAVVGSHAWNP
jgi:hypothetical protein